MAKTAGETSNQELRRWQQIQQAYPSQSEVVHQFPDGSTIQKPRTYGDADNLGQFMHNCWRANWDDDYRFPDGPHTPIAPSSPHGSYYQYHALHDAQGLPRAAFFLKTEPWLNQSHWTPKVMEAFGMRNRGLTPEQAAMLNQWADANGYEVGGRWTDPYFHEAAETGGSSWTVIDGPNDPIHKKPPGIMPQWEYLTGDAERVERCEHGQREDNCQQCAHKTAAEDELHVALDLPAHIADQIEAWAKEQDWPKGTELEDKSDYHITLLYAPDGHEEHADADWIPEVEGYDAEITGLDEFGEGDEKAMVLRIESPAISATADDLQDMADNRDLDISRFPGGYKPHITVAYGPAKPAYARAPKLKFKTGPSSVSTPRTAHEQPSAPTHREPEHKTAESDWEHWARLAGPPTAPPNYHVATAKDKGSCMGCQMFTKGKCWGYGMTPVEPEGVCDSFTPEIRPQYNKQSSAWSVWLDNSPEDEHDPFADYLAIHNEADRDSGELDDVPDEQVERHYENWVSDGKPHTSNVPHDDDIWQADQDYAEEWDGDLFKLGPYWYDSVDGDMSHEATDWTMPQTLYHAAPVSARDNIQNFGLKPGMKGQNWMHGTLEAARMYGVGQKDVWAVNTNGLPLQTGQGNWNAYTTQQHVEPQRLELVHQGEVKSDPLAEIWQRADTPAANPTDGVADTDTADGRAASTQDPDVTAPRDPEAKIWTHIYTRPEILSHPEFAARSGSQHEHHGDSGEPDNDGQIERGGQRHERRLADHQRGKTAAENVMYHTADPRDRESIRTQGLLTRHPVAGSSYAEMADNPPGVYLWPTYDSQDVAEGLRPDTWAVDTAGLRLLPDPQAKEGWPGSMYSSEPIGPERLQLVGEGQSESGESGASALEGGELEGQPEASADTTQPSTQSPRLTRVAHIHPSVKPSIHRSSPSSYNIEPWTPGRFGKGLVNAHTGDVHTWADTYDSPHHGIYRHMFGLPLTGTVPFYIAPDGAYYGSTQQADNKLVGLGRADEMTAHHPSLYYRGDSSDSTAQSAQDDGFSLASVDGMMDGVDGRKRRTFALDGTVWEKMDTLAPRPQRSFGNGSLSDGTVAGTPGMGTQRNANEDSPYGHKLWWTPGDAGRGFIVPDGSVHTWPEEEATHHERAYALNLDPTWNFHIRPDGQVARAYMHQAPSDEQIRLLQQADPRLQVDPRLKLDWGGFRQSAMSENSPRTASEDSPYPGDSSFGFSCPQCHSDRVDLYDANPENPSYVCDNCEHLFSGDEGISNAWEDLGSSPQQQGLEQQFELPEAQHPLGPHTGAEDSPYDWWLNHGWNTYAEQNPWMQGQEPGHWTGAIDPEVLPHLKLPGDQDPYAERAQQQVQPGQPMEMGNLIDLLGGGERARQEDAIFDLVQQKLQMGEPWEQIYAEALPKLEAIKYRDFWQAWVDHTHDAIKQRAQNMEERYGPSENLDYYQLANQNTRPAWGPYEPAQWRATAHMHADADLREEYQAFQQNPQPPKESKLAAQVSSLADVVSKLAEQSASKSAPRRKLIVRRDEQGRIASIEEESNEDEG